MKIKTNHPFIRESDINYITTRIEMPEYITEDNIYDCLDNLSIPSSNEFNIKKLSDEVKYNLIGSNLCDFIDSRKPDFDKIFNEVKNKIKVDNINDPNREICDWMLEAYANNIQLDAFCNEYNRHSQVVSRSGDGNIPGVSISDMSFVRDTGYNVCGRGYAFCITPYGRHNFRNRSVTGVIKKDFIGFGYVNADHSYQWCGALLRYIKLAKATLNNKIKNVRFPVLGKAIPLFFTQDPGEKTENISTVIRLKSSKEQNLTIRFRDPTNYENVLDEQKINISSGEYELSYGTASYPYVPPIVIEMEPEQPGSIDTIVLR